MRHLFCRIFMLICALFISQTTVPLIEEMAHLAKTLSELSGQLSSPVPMELPYVELQKVVNEVFTAQNVALFDAYPQTVAVLAARYLFNEIKEDKNAQEMAARIPLIAFFTEKIIKKYQNFDKSNSFNMVSLASGTLESELLLILALRHFGFKKIYLVAIDPIYEKEEIISYSLEQYKKKNIPVTRAVRDPQPEDGVKGVFVKDASLYIQRFLEGALGFPQNHLFLMIQPESIMAPIGLGISSIIKNMGHLAQPNTLRLRTIDGSKNIGVYLPYEQKNAFVVSQGMHAQAEEQEIAKIQNLLVPPVKGSAAYQPRLLSKIVQETYNTLSQKPFDIKVGDTGTSLTLPFLDIIRYTALDEKSCLGFSANIAYPKVEITDVSGSFKDVYIQYYPER